MPEPDLDERQRVRYWSDHEVANTLTVLRQGGLVLVKGDIGYGLFGTSETAIKKMYELKGRPYSNPCIVAGSLDLLDRITDLPDRRVRDWIASVVSWTTCAVVLPVLDESPMIQTLPPWVCQQTVTDGTVAVFLRTGPFLAEVIDRAVHAGWFFVGSSANRSATGNRFEFAEIPENIRRGADYALDHGRAELANQGRLATTIVNLPTMTLRRRGVNADAIEAQLEALKADYSRHPCGA